ncbi:MAG: hypothetical protein M1840_000054 [Geoglossum simile]|nr:MAG: hypothetical protein M1840_000054 [Geoglossum simile]
MTTIIRSLFHAGDDRDRKKQKRKQSKSKAFPSEPLQATITSRDNSEARQNAHKLSGNADPTGDVSDERRQTKFEKHEQSNTLLRKPLTSQADRDKERLEQRGHDNAERGKNDSSLGYTPDEPTHIYNYDPAVNPGEKSGSPSTPEVEKTKSRSWIPGRHSGTKQGKPSRGAVNSSPSKPWNQRGNKNRNTVSSNESDLSNTSVPNKPDFGAHSRPRDANVDETLPLQGKELQRTETEHEEDSGSRAVRKRISRSLQSLSPVVSRHFDREVPRSCSLEDIEMAIKGLIEALNYSLKAAHDTKEALRLKTAKYDSLMKSRDEGARRAKELEDRVSTLKKEKGKEREIYIEATTSALRAEYKKTLGEQQSLWRAKEKEQQSVWRLKEESYMHQLHQHEEAVEEMNLLLEGRQSKWNEMEHGYNAQIQQLESEKESWENTYRINVAELDRQHQMRKITLQSDTEEKIRKIREDCDDAVIELEGSMEQLKSEHGGRLNQLKLEHQEHMAGLRTRLGGEIAQKEKDCNDRVSQLERNLETTANSLYAEIDTMKEGHDREMMAKDREVAQIEAGHDIQMAQKRHQYEVQQRKMTEDHNAIVAALGKQREEEQRSLWKRIESLKGALVKGDRFKAMSDRELARRFQDLTSDVDAFARLRWDDGRVRTWPFPDKAFLSSENQRRDKQYLFQNTIWVILYEKIFFTPFRVLGKEGKSLEQRWMASFGQDRKSTGALAHGPVPTKESEKWRYETIQECLDATSQALEEGDANYNVKRDYELSLKETTDDMLKELGKVSSVSDIDKQNFKNLVRKAAKFWLEVGQQRYRLFLVMSDSDGEPTRSGQIAMNKDCTQKLVVVPELRRIGSGQGKGLENDELVADCKGVFNVFKFR